MTTVLQNAVAAWLASGSEEAARILVDGLYPQIIAIVRRHLPFRLDEDDLAQEVFVKLFTGLHLYNTRRPLENWVSRVTLNVCRDHLRRRACRPELRWADLGEGERRAVEAVLQSRDAPPEALADDARRLLHKLLDTLAANDRLVVTLIDIEEKSPAEVAALTGWSRVLVNVRAFRARRRLRKAVLALEKAAQTKML
jgi:RNA polymerase sigma-70 factor, ECF subfamily